MLPGMQSDSAHVCASLSGAAQSHFPVTQIRKAGLPRRVAVKYRSRERGGVRELLRERDKLKAKLGETVSGGAGGSKEAKRPFADTSHGEGPLTCGAWKSERSESHILKRARRVQKLTANNAQGRSTHAPAVRVQRKGRHFKKKGAKSGLIQ